MLDNLITIKRNSLYCLHNPFWLQHNGLTIFNVKRWLRPVGIENYSALQLFCHVYAGLFPTSHPSANFIELLYTLATRRWTGLRGDKGANVNVCQTENSRVYVNLLIKDVTNECALQFY